MKKLGRLFIISGTSQVGKSVVAKALQKNRQLRITNIRTNTTRPQRPEDKLSRQYNFYSLSEFKLLIKRGELLEWAKVHDHYYGTPRLPVEMALKRGRNVTLVIDVQGARQVKKIMPQAITIFITADSADEIRRRIMESPHIPTRQKKSRWQSALKELKAMKYYNYIIINRWGELSDSVRRISRIVKKYGQTKA